MADIVIECSNCGNKIKISEYASPETLTCVRCNARIAVPERSPDKPVSARLKLADMKGPETDEGPVREADTLADRRQRGPRRRRRSGPGRPPSMWAWLLFVVLVVTLAYLRFAKGALPPDTLHTLRMAGIGCIFLFHAVVIVYAFTDEAFQGVLCALIPGYSLYYLFFLADQFYLRAVMAALLVTFGLDTFSATKRFALDKYVRISHWIATTETMKKDRMGAP